MRNLVFLLVVLFACFQATEAGKVSYKDVDCGFAGITESQCLLKGCTWLPGFPGPWCQISTSPYIPSRFDLGFSNMGEAEKGVLTLAILSFVTLSIAVYLSNRTFSINKDYVAIGIFLVLAYVTRFHHIEHPKEVVFDEFYFGHFANSYCNKVYVFDIHPPLAKLTHYIAGHYLGAECTMDYHAKDPLDKYDNAAQYVPYRIVSAFFGTLVVPLTFMVGRKFNFSLESSILLGALTLCDSLLLSETRLVLTDSQLYFYIVLSVYCALQLWDSEKGSRARDLWTVATAVASGCAFAVKFTALATLGWIAFGTFIAVNAKRAPVDMGRCLIASLIAAVVFIIPFWFHFKFGQNSGRNDWNIDAEHQQLLKGNPHYNANAVAPLFLPHLFYLLKRMFEQNAASLGSHPYASFWYQWIVGGGALLSYSEHRDEEDWHGHIFIVSSVFICYSILVAIFAFVVVALTILRSRVAATLSAREVNFLKTGSLLLLGWVANLLPYALVARTTYSYHHLPAQFFGMIILALVVEDLPVLFLSLFYKNNQLNRYVRKVRTFVIIVFMFALFYQFFYYSAFSYGFGLNNIEYSKRKWAVSGV